MGSCFWLWRGVRYRVINEEDRYMPRLENWSIVGDFNPYQAPECRVRQLNGEIYDDEMGRFEDGRRIISSRIMELDIINNFAQTRNTKYILGKMSDDYAEWLEFNKIELNDVIS